MIDTDFQWPAGLEQAFFDVATDGHDFTSCLHLGSQTALTMFKFIKWETWNFGNYIVQGWLKHGIGGSCNWIDHLIQGQTNCDFGRQLGNRITCRLGCQGRRTRNTRIDLNHIVFKAMWIQGQLHITAPLNLEGTNDAEAGIPQHLVFDVR